MYPLVSVIVPVYNTSPYLYRCLDSLCHQTYQHLEIICINDGSTDDSLDILLEYARKDSRIKVISTENHGQGAARNIGIECAKGEWITGLDSDDYWLPDTCEYVIANACKNVNIIQFGFFTVKEDKDEYIPNPGRLKGLHQVSVETLVRQHCEFWNKFWRKSYIDRHNCRFPEGVWYEDYFFYWAYLPLTQSILYLPECKYVYVRRNDSTMSLSNKKNNRIINHINVLELLLEYRSHFPSNNIYPTLNLINFIQSWRFVEPRLSDNNHKMVSATLTKLSNHPLMKPWQKWLRYFNVNSSKCRLFVKYCPNGMYYGLWIIWPIKVCIEDDWIVWRFLGRRFLRYKLKSLS